MITGPTIIAAAELTIILAAGINIITLTIITSTGTITGMTIITVITIGGMIYGTPIVYSKWGLFSQKYLEV